MRKKQATKPLALLTLISLLFLTSCSVVGYVYEHENIEKLTEGMTEQEVASILGAKPHIRTTLENGNYLLLWSYVHASALGTTGLRNVNILFSSNNKMIRVIHTSQSGKAL